MTIWEHFWQSSKRALDACERQQHKQKGATDDLASSVADLVKNLFVGKCQNALRQRTLDYGSDRESEDEEWKVHRDTAHRATVSRSGQFGQLVKKADNFSISHAQSLQNASYVTLGNLAMDG